MTELSTKATRNFSVRPQPYLYPLVLWAETLARATFIMPISTYITPRQPGEMASAVQQNGEGRAMVVNGNLDEVVNGTASTSLDWEEFEVNIGWGTMRGKIRGEGPRLMLGE